MIQLLGKLRRIALKSGEDVKIVISSDRFEVSVYVEIGDKTYGYMGYIDSESIRKCLTEAIKEYEV